MLTALGVAGCAPTLLNLTPNHLPRMANGLYPFEVQWDSPRRGANNPSTQAYVVIETNFFPMTRVVNTANRWEALVPLPEGRSYIPYHYKFDYTYPGLPETQKASDLSDEYHAIVPAH